MKYHCPVRGIEMDYVEIEGIPAMEITIEENLLASWSELMATQVIFYFYEEPDEEEYTLKSEDIQE